MPHFIVEYTNNIKTEAYIPELLKKVNLILMENADIFPKGGIRSRAIGLEDYCIADGKEDDAFVHATFKMGAGRTEEQKKKVCNELFNMMCTHFEGLFTDRYLALSMEIAEFSESGTYKKNNIHSRFSK
ncbi:5-carboxymethyl-2-hydroxymuconate Delta-isomerase [Bacillus sp. 1P06AnD]|uniref:5-carboxymethyl-2-hydroxymuconate Delta-isomerase n=1 Tax=Bacillus sp. 1P06AnD TaxID=3132208 RepID=UPI0039A2BBB2